MRLIKLAICAVLLSASAFALTTVSDTIYTATGATCSGSLTLAWQTFYAPDGHLISAGTASFTVAAGAFSASVEPGQYAVTYQIFPTGCTPKGENWLVPNGGGPYTLAQVRTLNAPSNPTLIPWTWMAQNGAIVGDSPVWNGSAWVPGTPAGTGGGWHVAGGTVVICTGNASTDTAGLQAAVTTPNTSLWAYGACVVNAPILVTAANVSFIGSGPAYSVTAENSANLHNVIKATNTAVNFKLSNIIVDGSRATLGTAQDPTSNDYACVSVHAAHATVSNAEVRNCQATSIYVGDSSVKPDGFSLTGSYIHDNGGTINSSGFGTGVFLDGTGGTGHAHGARIIGNHFENNYNTITGPGMSSAVNGFSYDDVLVEDNFVKNNYNVAGGQLVAGGAPGGLTCAGYTSNWTFTGNTVIRTSSFMDGTEGIEVCASPTTITGNTFIGTATAYAAVGLDGGVSQIAVTGNTSLTSVGVNIPWNDTSTVSDVVISGNTFYGGLYGILMTGAAGSVNYPTNISIIGNNLTGNSNNLYDNASGSTSISIINNPGANPPQGGVFTGGITVTASPFTYTASHRPEFVSIAGGTISSVVTGGGTLCTAAPCSVQLSPNQPVTVTYSSIPTMTKMIQ